MKTGHDLSVCLGKLKLKNPVTVASGTFGYGNEYSRYLNLSAIGAIITKAVTLEPRIGNPPPRIVETTAGLLNAIGLANVGVEAFVRDKLPFLRKLDTKILVNVAGSTEKDYLAVVRRLEYVRGIAGLEINVSCPNVKKGGLSFGVDAAGLRKFVGKLRKATRRFLMIKLSPNVTDITTIARSAEDAGAEALSLINTLAGMAVDIRTRRSKLENVMGGLSGPAIKPVALACVWKVRQAVSIPLIGGGGIMGADDALEFMIAGARAVSIGTANFINPKTAAETVRDLKKYCRKHDINRISSLVGTLQW